MYRVGFPGWKLAAKLGVPVRLRVFIAQDLEGLVLEGQTLEEIKNEALSCSKILLEIALNKSAPETQTDFIWHTVQQASA